MFKVFRVLGFRLRVLGFLGLLGFRDCRAFRV